MIEDEKLWKSLKAGEKQALGSLYERYVGDLLNYGGRLTADVALLEDCVHDLFVEIWKGREKLCFPASVKFYLFKALRYKVLRNKQKNAAEHLQMMPALFWGAPDNGPEQELIESEVYSEQMRHLKETLDSLPSRQKEAINLRYFHLFTNEEIAQIMGVNYHSACKFIYAGLKSLKENLRVSVMSIAAWMAFLHY